MTSPEQFYQRDWSIHPPAYSPGYKTSVARSPSYSKISLDNSVGELTEIGRAHV